MISESVDLLLIDLTTMNYFEITNVQTSMMHLDPNADFEGKLLELNPNFI